MQEGRRRRVTQTEKGFWSMQKARGELSVVAVGGQQPEAAGSWWRRCSEEMLLSATVFLLASLGGINIQTWIAQCSGVGQHVLLPVNCEQHKAMILAVWATAGSWGPNTAHSQACSEICALVSWRTRIVSSIQVFIFKLWSMSIWRSYQQIGVVRPSPFWFM